MGRIVKALLFLGLVVVVVTALRAIKETPTSPATAAAPLASAGAEVPCTPGDQDPYVYRPERLKILKPCLHVTGTVDDLQIEADGDVHYRVRLDPPYTGLLVDGNKAQGGDLVVEPVCYALAYQADAMGVCSSDRNSLRSIPQAGDHVWMEGRYVLDIGHTTWAELHPLYRWGKVER